MECGLEMFKARRMGEKNRTLYACNLPMDENKKQNGYNCARGKRISISTFYLLKRPVGPLFDWKKESLLQSSRETPECMGWTAWMYLTELDSKF